MYRNYYSINKPIYGKTNVFYRHLRVLTPQAKDELSLLPLKPRFLLNILNTNYIVISELFVSNSFTSAVHK